MSKTATPDADGWLENPATGRRLRVDASAWAVDGVALKGPADGAFHARGGVRDKRASTDASSTRVEERPTLPRSRWRRG